MKTKDWGPDSRAGAARTNAILAPSRMGISRRHHLCGPFHGRSCGPALGKCLGAVLDAPAMAITAGLVSIFGMVAWIGIERSVAIIVVIGATMVVMVVVIIFVIAILCRRHHVGCGKIGLCAQDRARHAAAR